MKIETTEEILADLQRIKRELKALYDTRKEESKVEDLGAYFKAVTRANKSVPKPHQMPDYNSKRAIPKANT